MLDTEFLHLVNKYGANLDAKDANMYLRDACQCCWYLDDVDDKYAELEARIEDFVYRGFPGLDSNSRAQMSHSLAQCLAFEIGVISRPDTKDVSYPGVGIVAESYKKSRKQHNHIHEADARRSLDDMDVDSRGWKTGPYGYGQFDPDTYDWDNDPYDTSKPDGYENSRKLSDIERTQYYWGSKAHKRIKGMGNKNGAIKADKMGPEGFDMDVQDSDQFLLEPDNDRSYILGQLNNHSRDKCYWNGEEFVHSDYGREGQQLKRNEKRVLGTNIFEEFAKACQWVAMNNTKDPKDISNIVEVKIAQYKF